MELVQVACGNFYVQAAVAGVAGVTVLRSVAAMVSASRRKAKIQARLAAQEKGVVYLHVFPRVKDAPQGGGPGLAVETFLRAAKIPYVVLPTLDPSESPTERLPMIEVNGKQIAETQFIFEALQKEFPEHCARNMSALTSPKERAIATLLQRTLNYSYKFAFYRLVLIDNKAVMANRFGPLMPSWMPQFVLNKMLEGMRQNSIKMMNMEGFGDINDQQYRAEFQRDLEAIEAILQESNGGKGFALGTEKPSAADCHVFGWLRNAAQVPLPELEPLRKGVLQTYISSMEARLFPDAPELAASVPSMKPEARRN